MSPDQYQRLVAELTPNPTAAVRTRELDGRQLLHYKGTTYELEREEPLRFAMIGVNLIGHDPNRTRSSRPSVGAWLWSSDAGSYVRILEPAYFPLHLIAETDPRFHALARAQRVETASTSYLLWAPAYVPAERVHHRGWIAVALDAAAAWHDGTPALWLDGKPYVFVRAETMRFHDWLDAHAAGRAVWFTYDGASLHSLLSVHVDSQGLLVVDVERVVG